MKLLNHVSVSFQLLSAKYILQYNCNPYFYFGCLLLTSFHYWIATLLPANDVIKVIKYLEPSMYLQPNVLIYFLFIGCLLPASLILIQIYLCFKFKSISYSIIQKYSITCMGYIGHFMITFGMLPLLRVCFVLKGYPSQSIEYKLSFVTLIIYLGIILPFYGILIVDLSPVSKNIYACYHYFNIVRIYPFARLIINIDHVISKTSSAVTVISSFVVIFILMVLHPIWHYNYGTQIRAIIYATTWILQVRTIATIQSKPVSPAIVVIVSIIYMFFFFFISEWRMKQIITKSSKSFQKIKALLFAMNNYESEDQYLGLFLINHLKQCTKVDCHCQNIKQNVIQNQKPKIKWYQFLIQIIDETYNYKEYLQLPKSRRQRQIGKLIQITRARADIMGHKLRKWHTAYYTVEQTLYQIDQHQKCQFNYRVYRLGFIVNMNACLKKNVLQEGAINLFAQKYYEYHAQLNKIISYMKKSSENHIGLWRQLLDREPQQQKILQLIQNSYNTNLKVQNLISKFKAEHENIPIYNQIFTKYFIGISNNENIKLEIPAKIDLNKIPSEDLKYFHLQALIKYCVVSLDPQTFGEILSSNSFFRQYVDFQGQININQLIIHQMQTSHSEKMRQFINSGKLMMNKNQLLIKVKQQQIKIIKVLIQLIPSVSNGFKAIFFIKKEQPRTMFICKEGGKITFMTQQLLQFLDQNGIQLRVFRSYFNSYVVDRLKNTQTTTLTINNNSCLIKLQRIIQSSQNEKDEDKKQKVFLCNLLEISQNKYQPISQIEAQVEDKKAIQSQKQLKSHISLKNQKEKQKIDQQKIQRENNLQKIFSVVNSTKTPCYVIIWRIVAVLMVILIIAVGIYFILESQSIKTRFQKEGLERRKFDEVEEKIYNSLYYLRKSNIEALTRKSPIFFKEYINKVTVQNQRAISHFSNITFDYERALEVFEINQVTGKVNLINSNAYVAFKQKTFLSLSRVANASIQMMNLPLKVSEWSKPYNIIQKSILESKINGENSVLPNFDLIIYELSEKSNCLLGKCFKQQKILIVGLICLLIKVIFIVYTFALNFKIKSIRDKSYNLISKLNKKQIDYRLKIAEDYFQKAFGLEEQKTIKDLHQKTIVSGFRSRQNLNLKKQKQTIKRLSNSNQMSFINKNQSNQISIKQVQLSQSQRNFFYDPQKKIQKKQVKTNQLTAFNVVSNHNCGFLLKIVIIISFITILLIFIVIYHSQKSNQFLQNIANTDILHNRIKLIKAIKLYSLEIGFNQGLYNKDQTYNIPNILGDKIQYLYILQRRVINEIIYGIQDSQIKQMVDKYNNLNICNLLSQLPYIPNFQNSFNLSECSLINGRTYLTFGLRTAILSFLQDAQVIYDKYKDKTNITTEERLIFVSQTEHQILNSLDNYISVIVRFQISALQFNFLQRLNKYVQNMLISCLILIFVALIVGWQFLIIISSQFNKYRRNISAIFYILSENTIKNKKELSQAIIKDINYLFLQK